MTMGHIIATPQKTTEEPADTKQKGHQIQVQPTLVSCSAYQFFRDKVVCCRIATSKGCPTGP